MTLDRFRSVVYRAVGPFVTAADAAGLSPNAVSAVAFTVAVAAGGAFSAAGGGPGSGLVPGPPSAGSALYLVGAGLVFANGWLDVVDGELARRQGVDSRAGDLLDHVLDRYADIVILVGLAAGVDRWGLGLVAVTGVLMTSYLGTQAQAVGLDRAYGGLLGRADRLALTGVVTAIAAVVPGVVVGAFGGLTLVGVLLAVFGLVGHLTAVQRFYHAFGALS